MTKQRLPILRSTPLRLTVWLISAFSVSTALSFGAAYVVVERSADAVLREAVLQDFESYRIVRGQRNLIEKVIEQITTVPPRTTIIDYRSDDGNRFSNVQGLPSLGGVSIVGASEIPLEADKLADSYVVVEGRVGAGHLTLAQNREHVDDLFRIFGIILAVSLLPTLAIASVLGLWSARRARNRVEAIRGTLRQLASGDLEARVPEMRGMPDDLTEMGGAVNRMAAAQAASVASLRQVSADIAHDLKTPIQRVSVLLSQLEEAGLTGAQAEIAAKARNETAGIVKTFQALLQIAQIEGGRVEERFGQVDLGSVLDDIVDVFGPSAEESGHVLRAAPAAGAIVTGDRTLIGQVIANLIENALRHTPAGSTIEAGVSMAGAPVLWVADDGPGIPESERENVLKRHYRLDNSRTTDGAGLGLSLVAAIADLHDAELVMTDAAPGLRVELRFPQRAASRPERLTE